MAEWHYARELRRTAYDALGLDNDRAKLHMAIEPIVDKLWSQGERDFSWYDTPMYALSCVECFVDFTKGGAAGFAQWLVGEGARYEVKTVVDFCCGVGASTRYMMEKAPGIAFIAHNYSNATMQTRVASAVLEPVGNGVLVADEPDMFPKFDAIAAFELLEHVEKPLEMVDAWEEMGARVIGEVSSFHIDNYGHFPVYELDDVKVGRSDAARVFTRHMKERGWVNAWSGWNGKPRVWLKVGQ